MSQARIARYCPLCGTLLEIQERSGRPRPVCPNCEHIVYFEPKVAVAICIFQDEKLLLIQRGVEPMAGYWAMPAGFMEYDENPPDAARREALEETGLKVQIERILEIFHTPDDGGLADIVITYAASIEGGQMQAEDDARAVAWFSKAELPDKIAFLPSQTIVRRWLAGEV
jgi:ADP-ribose pyrophosphatase YjhB (NUDIX family)